MSARRSESESSMPEDFLFEEEEEEDDPSEEELDFKSFTLSALRPSVVLVELLLPLLPPLPLPPDPPGLQEEEPGPRLIVHVI